ncbi:MAG: NAD(P)H-binding protein [Deltaproteobacteria bacterium]|nr:NAD(P)H-binding protein [Deltaproteobacteria bacterium]
MQTGYLDRNCVVTGAFGYTGKYITARLLDAGAIVKNLTGHPDRPDPFGGRVAVETFEFEDPDKLAGKLRGADVVFNTYWVRFNYGRTTFSQAVANSQNLIRAAAEAGVKRFVHISITNPSLDSRLQYFRGKAEIEATLVASGLSYAIIRPTVLFGKEDILINNIAWMLRRLPAFGIFSHGRYRMQPVFVDDVARLAVELGMRSDNVTCDAVGPETYSYNELVTLVKRAVNGRALIAHIPPFAALAASALMNRALGDIVISREEIEGLMDELLVSYGRPLCKTSFSAWVKANASGLGMRYSSEVRRHFV